MTTLIQTNHSISLGETSFTFLPGGDLYEAAHGDIMINQVLGNPVDGSLNNLYLRLHRNSEISVFPLLGAKSGSTVTFSENQAVFQGTAENVRYEVTFSLSTLGVWFWEITLEGSGVTADLLYGQDIGLAHRGAVRTNEAFVAQYIDHSVYSDEKTGYVVCSRQNQPQDGKFPYLQQGSLTKASGYSTDGFQFFGLSYKETNEPEAFYQRDLPNEIYQYEFAYTGLQSKRIALEGKAEFVFYGLFREDHPEAVAAPEFEDVLFAAWNETRSFDGTFSAESKIASIPLPSAVLKTFSMQKEDVDLLFPDRIQEEYSDGQLLSFFTGSYEHAVLKEKELQMERPHGHILMNSVQFQHPEKTITTTSHIYGIFNSQLAYGNTSFHKMLTNQRNPLNILKTSGQRIYLETESGYELLGLPSLFEIGFNYARWYYKTADDLIVVTNFTAAGSPAVQLVLRSMQGKAYRCLVTHQVSMNNNEYEVPFGAVRNGQTIAFTASEKADSAGIYPGLQYSMTLDAEFNISEHEAFEAASLFVIETEQTASFTMTIKGSFDNSDGLPAEQLDAKEEIEEYRRFLKKTMNHFQLQHPSQAAEKLNILSWWYTHNMLVHYSVPHGLEQYGGAAWGTRDVCQGPAEYFLTTRNDEAVKHILRTVFSHQYEDTGNWPQWFMFDRYSNLQQEESHGDIIVWPLKLLSDYLLATGDTAILKEKVSYTDRESGLSNGSTATILEHAQKEIRFIKSHFLSGTSLSAYGDGDWDDTLQPANPSLKKHMASSWTVALTYQAFRQFSNALSEYSPEQAKELAELADSIQQDFSKYMLDTPVIPGFLYMENESQPEKMVHPEDKKTGIQYRLLPLTRSMIAELVSPEQAKTNLSIIKEHLSFPDGVRLMNRPASYKGGVSTNFKRAEQAANFGREVGLQYVHAHIRFIEAMAKLGKPEEVWQGLEAINPVGITSAVPNAALRQSNAYFSSSDGKFSTRHEAEENFEKLKTGETAVKGGWRIYSSGPGIYMNQLLSNCLGIRFHADSLVLDPVLTESLNGLKVRSLLYGKPAVYSFSLGCTESKVLVNGKEVQTQKLDNPYRQGGLLVQKSTLLPLLDQEENVIEIQCN